MFGRRDYDDEECGSSGVRPNVSYNFDAQMYGSQENSYDETSGWYAKSRERAAEKSGSSYRRMNGTPADSNGNPVVNHFVLKMVLAILELIFSRLFGILAIVFTCQQNSAYNREDWNTFRRKRKAANICLWIGYVLSIVVIVAIIVYFTTLSSQHDDFYEEMKEALEYTDNTDWSDFGDLTDIFGDDSSSWTTADDDYGDEDYKDPGDDIDIEGMYTLECDGTQLTFQETTVGELLDSVDWDWEDPEAFEDTLVEGDGYDGFCFGEWGNNLVEVYNYNTEDVPVREAVVVELYLYLSGDDDIEFCYMDTLTQDSDAEDFITVLGDGYEYYRDDDDWAYYTWYTESGYIAVIYDADGSMLSLDINAY